MSDGQSMTVRKRGLLPATFLSRLKALAKMDDGSRLREERSDVAIRGDVTMRLVMTALKVFL